MHGRKSALRKKANRGFRGYPIATLAFYGPDDQVASKLAVAILPRENAEVSAIERWFSDQGDVRADPNIEAEAVDFIRRQGVKTVLIADAIMGCPHEEGIDYAEGVSCPTCPYWAGRDRFTKVRIQ